MIAQLKLHDWPGNIRELQNLIERAVITSTGGSLRLEMPQPTTSKAAERGEGQCEEPSILTEAQLKKLERENIIKALQATDGKVSGSDGTAALLGMKPSTLSSRIKSMQVRRVIC